MSWPVIIFLIISGVVVCFAAVLAFGAPYLPTLNPQIKTALELIDLKPGQTLLELGSGDGRVMAAAASQGLNVIGYELNPLLVLFSRWRLRRYRELTEVVWGNYWSKKLPRADGIFTFLLNPYMKKLDNKIIQDLGTNVKLVSFAFEIPGRKKVRTERGVHLYQY